MEHQITTNATEPLASDPGSGHNRWHEDIPPILEISPGDVVTADVRDALDGQVHPHTTASDLSAMSFDGMHPLTGPFAIRGAEPGDLLAVHLHHVEPDPWMRRAVTLVAPEIGVLAGELNEQLVVHWEMREDGRFAESEQLPGVRVPGAPFLGTIGVAPAREQREAALEAEREYVESGRAVPQPLADGCVPDTPAVSSGGLRTLPPRDINGGGNTDVAMGTAGATFLIPVQVPQALLSFGDAHFNQGDGEICGTGIEMRARVRFSCSLRKAQASEGQQVRILRDSPYAPASWATPERFYAVTGIDQDPAEAAKDAVRRMLRHLEGRGLGRREAYALCSAAVSLRISELTDYPFTTVVALLALDVFRDGATGGGAMAAGS